MHLLRNGRHGQRDFLVLGEGQLTPAKRAVSSKLAALFRLFSALTTVTPAMSAASGRDISSRQPASREVTINVAPASNEV
jgi:hypothetical protein